VTPEALWGGDAALHRLGRQTVHQLGARPPPVRPAVSPPEHRACAKNIAARTTSDEPALPNSGAAARASDGGLWHDPHRQRRRLDQRPLEDCVEVGC
jgi:hypothetical protein